MNKWLKLAIRNIFRNKRRSLVTLAAIGVGFASISLFRGYASSAYWGMRESAIRGEGLGHLIIYKAGWIEKGKLEPESYMFSEEEVESVITLVSQEREVVLATPQIHITGLVSNGIVSTVFIGEGVIPTDDRTIKGAWGAFRPVMGEGLQNKTPSGAVIARDLARYLDLEPGKTAVVMAPTLNGQINALDILVAGTYDTGSEATNDKYIRLNFDFAQSLYDTKMAERIIVLLMETQETERMRSLFLKLLGEAGIGCEIMTWNEASMSYSKVKSMFDMILAFIFSIVLIIVVMSTVNTMGMAVLERTREIGTLRALGLKRRGVLMLFAVEGGMLGLMGSVIGAVLHMLVWMAIRIFGPSYTPPGSSAPVPLMVDLVPGFLLALVLCLFSLCLLAAVFSARRAAARNIVDALGHV
ncbi:MAG: ABC transporter permease [Thermodesulfobacteriota bacterium]